MTQGPVADGESDPRNEAESFEHAPLDLPVDHHRPSLIPSVLCGHGCSSLVSRVLAKTQ